MNQIEKIEQQLLEIEKNLEKLSTGRSITQACYNLWKERKILKRNLSLEKGEETAVPINWEYTWDSGAPMPHIVSNGYRVFLVYYLGKPDPNWDGTYVKVVNTSSDIEDLIVLVEFTHVVNYKFGGPNDEVIHGHPLYEHGLEAYTAHEIINSKWLVEQEQINSVHSCYSSERWKNLRHLIFTFHDEVFECITQGYKVEMFKGRFREVVFEATTRLFATQ
ncbi:hypothetical protein [Bacteroides sp. 519]|uniref:hypothetical protein n=1 Tax=Bacteroides sp. 519 TaxID=2302937 RepID=UPI0013D0EACB|nr:hypothetical protein [Bacteroides sp. 519]NDV58112.1 hypothetical protein [Bacteroides sp. 519]